MIESMLIAGASRGIGLAIAAHFAPRVPALHTASRTPSPHGAWIAADLATQAGVDAVAGRLAGRRLDALIYAGGTWETGAFTDRYDFAGGPLEDIDRVVAVNLVAPIKLVRGLLPCLRRAPAPRVLLIGALSGLDNAATREIAPSGGRRAAGEKATVAAIPRAPAALKK